MPHSLRFQVDEEEEWAEDEEVPYEARLKIRALKTYVNRCMSHASLASAEDVFKPVLNMLFAILNNMGSTKPNFADQYVCPLSYTSAHVTHIQLTLQAPKSKLVFGYKPPTHS